MMALYRLLYFRVWLFMWRSGRITFTIQNRRPKW